MNKKKIIKAKKQPACRRGRESKKTTCLPARQGKQKNKNKIIKKKVKTPKTKISAKLIKLLDENKVKYEIVKHRTVFTAYDLAQTLRIKPQEITKTLAVKLDKDCALAILPGNLKLDFNKLKKAAKSKKAGIISEKEMATMFKIIPGAITPFGSLYKMPIYLEAKLLKSAKLLFQAGSFNESIKMQIKDFVKLENPIKGNFGKSK